MKQGIIGNAADKFTVDSEIEAKRIIGVILDSFSEGDILVSGHCPMGGIDIWAEEEAITRGFTKDRMDIKDPRQHHWEGEYGFKARNLDIARQSKKLHVILVDKYPQNYIGRRFNICYHCNSTLHIKSGACWTAKKAEGFGNEVKRYIIKN